MYEVKHAKRDRRRSAIALFFAVAGLAVAGLVSWLVGWAGDTTVESVTRSPLLVDVQSSSQFSTIFPADPDELDIPGTESGSAEEFVDAAVAQGGAAAGRLTVTMDVSSGLDRPVVITGLDVEVLSAAAPLTGVHVPPQGAGGIHPRLLQAEVSTLGSLSPEILVDDDADRWAFPLQVGVGVDLERLVVLVDPVDCLCEFEFVLRYETGGQADSIRIDDGGNPFRLSSVENASPLAVDEMTGQSSRAMFRTSHSAGSKASQARSPTTVHGTWRTSRWR